MCVTTSHTRCILIKCHNVTFNGNIWCVLSIRILSVCRLPLVFVKGAVTFSPIFKSISLLSYVFNIPSCAVSHYSTRVSCNRMHIATHIQKYTHARSHTRMYANDTAINSSIAFSIFTTLKESYHQNLCIFTPGYKLINSRSVIDWFSTVDAVCLEDFTQLRQFVSGLNI